MDVNKQLLDAIKPFADAYGCWTGGAAQHHFGVSVVPAHFRAAAIAYQQAIAAAEQVTLCASCGSANVDCPIYPQQTSSCIEHRGQQQAELVAREFFAYDPECGFETFKTEAEAKKYAQDSIDSYREEASEGWSELVNNVCWGIVLGTTREVALPDEYNGRNGLADDMKPVDYVLTTAQPPAVAESPVRKEVCAVWDVFNGKDWFMAVTSPLGFDAKGVHDALVAQRYAPHLNVIARHCVTEGNPVVGLISELERVRSELAACQSATQSPALAVPDGK